MAAEHAESFTLLSLIVVIVALRTFVRVRNVGFRGLQLDDYLMPVAAVSQPTLTSTPAFGLD